MGDKDRIEYLKSVNKLCITWKGCKTLEDKDKIDCLKFISQIHRSQLNERRKYEWQIFYAALFFYTVCIFAILGNKIKLDVWGDKSKLIWGAIITVLAYVIIVFLTYLHRANNTNKTFAERAEDKIDGMLDGRVVDKSSLFSSVDHGIYWRNLLFLWESMSVIWGWVCQVYILLLFAATSVALVTGDIGVGIAMLIIFGFIVVLSDLILPKLKHMVSPWLYKFNMFDKIIQQLKNVVLFTQCLCQCFRSCWASFLVRKKDCNVTFCASPFPKSCWTSFLAKKKDSSKEKESSKSQQESR